MATLTHCVLSAGLCGTASMAPSSRGRAIVPAISAGARAGRRSAIRISAAAESASPASELPAASTAPLDRQLPEADGRFAGLKVLVAGATGGVGKAVVQQLTAQGVPVVALVRDGVKAAGVLPPASAGVQIVEGDVYQYASVAKAVQGCNAVICATGPTDRLNPLGPFTVDCEGTRNLVAAARQAGAKKFVLVTSIGVDDPFFPLNLYWGVLFWKKRGEEAVQRSGIDYTILRPGGLLNEPRPGQSAGRVVVGGPDAFGLPPRRRPGSVLRSQVAEACVAALVEPAASGKVVELIAEQDAPALPFTELFASV